MLQPLLTALGDGLAAFVVVGVMLAIFRRANEPGRYQATCWGIALSIVVTPVAGLLFASAANQAWWEGVLALGAAAGVASMAVHLWHTMRRRRELARPGRWMWAVTLAITVLMITRGSMVIALLLGTMLWQVPAVSVIVGTAAGTTLAAAIAWVWARFVRRMRRTHFREVTGIFLVLYVAQLLVDGVHEVAESGALGGGESVLRVTQSWSSDGVYGMAAPYLLIVVPLAWWLVAIFLGHGKAAAGRVAHMGR